jgi:hypothetical protein
MFTPISRQLGEVETIKPSMKAYNESLEILRKTELLRNSAKKLLKQAMPSLAPNRVNELASYMVENYRRLIPEYTRELIKSNPLFSRNDIEQSVRGGVLKDMVKELNTALQQPEMFREVTITRPMVSAIYREPTIKTTYYATAFGVDKRAARAADVGFTKTGLISKIIRSTAPGLRPIRQAVGKQKSIASVVMTAIRKGAK